MKTIIKKSLVVALMLGTLISYAKEGIISNDNDAKETVKIEFKDVKKGQVLTIKDSEGVTIYNKEIKSEGNYSKIFNFSALGNGKYTAELNKDFEIVIKQFYVKNGLVTFLNNKNEKVFKPVIRAEGNLVYLSKIAFNNQPLNVVIYYNNEKILSETIKGGKILKRVYKLSKNQSGNYRVVINTDDRSYFKDITI